MLAHLRTRANGRILRQRRHRLPMPVATVPELSDKEMGRGYA